MTESVDAGLPLRRAFVRVGGKPVVHHQLEIALAFGCERVICRVRSLDPEVIAMQHMAEDAGRLFHTIAVPSDLSGLVTAADELVVFSDGLLTDHARAQQVLETGTGVFVQPVETGLATGFERLDINHAAAGMLRIPGRVVEGAAQLPPDCDLPSALTRMALQAGIAMREIPAEARSGVRWQIIKSESDAYAIEHDWLAEQLGNPRMVSPGRWLARKGVLTFGSSLLHAGNAMLVMIVVMLALMAAALGLSWLGAQASGFLLCSGAWIMHRAAILLRRIEIPVSEPAGQTIRGLDVLEWLLDLELIIFLTWASSVHTPDQGPVAQAFAPAVLILLIRLVSQLRELAETAWLSDRTVLCLLLALFAGLGWIHWVVVFGSLALLLLAIALCRERVG